MTVIHAIDTVSLPPRPEQQRSQVLPTL